MADTYISQFQNNGGEWQRRLENGQVAKGSKPTPYVGIPQEKPGKGNN